MVSIIQRQTYLLLVCWVAILISGNLGHAFSQNLPLGWLQSYQLGVSTLPRRQEAAVQNERIRLDMVGHVHDNPDGLIPLDNPEGLTPMRQPLPDKLNPMEVWCLIRIEKWYSRALNRKCPFLRRRMTDIMELVEMVIRMTLIRKEKVDLVCPPVSLRGDERTRHKLKHLSRSQLLDVIRRDWRKDSQKGYYITGRLTPGIYRDDCFFDGPDPDMPVRGLRKFLNAASQLFDPRESFCELLNLEIQGDVIVADWKMNGVIRLPWGPKMPEVQGQTTYHFDEDGLISRHEETWDLSAMDAFTKTAWFDFHFNGAHGHNQELQEAEVYE